MAPDRSSSAMTGLLPRIRPTVNSTLLRATASTNSGLSAVRVPRYSVSAMAGRDLGQQLGQMAEVRVGDGSLDCAARRMPLHDDQFRARDLRRVLQAPEYIRALDGARDPAVEDGTQAQVEDDFGRRPRVHAPEHDRRRRLVGRGPLLLHQPVAVTRPAGAKSLIAGFRERDDLVRADSIPGGSRQRTGSAFVDHDGISIAYDVPSTVGLQPGVRVRVEGERLWTSMPSRNRPSPHSCRSV